MGFWFFISMVFVWMMGYVMGFYLGGANVYGRLKNSKKPPVVPKGKAKVQPHNNGGPGKKNMC